MILTATDTLDRSMIQWQWYADNPTKSKRDYFTENDIKEIPVFCCYLCEYANLRRGYDHNICHSKCLLIGEWGNDEYYCTGLGVKSFYTEWCEVDRFGDINRKRIAALKVLGLLTAARAKLDK